MIPMARIRKGLKFRSPKRTRNWPVTWLVISDPVPSTIDLSGKAVLCETDRGRQEKIGLYYLSISSYEEITDAT